MLLPVPSTVAVVSVLAPPPPPHSAPPDPTRLRNNPPSVAPRKRTFPSCLVFSSRLSASPVFPPQTSLRTLLASSFPFHPRPSRRQSPSSFPIHTIPIQSNPSQVNQTNNLPSLNRYALLRLRPLDSLQGQKPKPHPSQFSTVFSPQIHTSIRATSSHTALRASTPTTKRPKHRRRPSYPSAHPYPTHSTCTTTPSSILHLPDCSAWSSSSSSSPSSSSLLAASQALPAGGFTLRTGEVLPN